MGNLYKIQKDGSVAEIREQVGLIERDHQKIIEQNLPTFLRLTFLATEHSTGVYHKGRIDTLAIDENFCPVIIEYKKDITTTVVNQGFYYLSWLLDHEADFSMLVLKTLGEDIQKKIIFSRPRLICIAPDFNKFDIHMVSALNGKYRIDIQLIKFMRTDQNHIQFETISTRPTNGLNKKKLKESIPTKPKVLRQKAVVKRLNDSKWKFTKLYKKLCGFTLGMGTDVELKETTEYVVARKLFNLYAILGYDDRMKVGFDFYSVKDKDILDAIEPYVSVYPSELVHKRESLYKTEAVNIQLSIMTDSQLELVYPILQTIYDRS